MRRSKVLLAGVGAVAALAPSLLLSGLLHGTGTPAAVDPPAPTAATASVTAMTWNLCGDGRDSTPVGPGYCPERAYPQKKADAVKAAVDARGVNAVLLQETCTGSLNSAARGPSLTDLILQRLGPEWHTSAQIATTDRADGSGSHCREGDTVQQNLSGTYSSAIVVKGEIVDEQTLTEALPVPAGAERTMIQCVSVKGWETRVCNAHLANGNVADGFTPAHYDAEVDKVLQVVSQQLRDYRSVLLGGDFNTRDRGLLARIYAVLPECDQEPFYTADGGDAANEATKATPVVQTTGADERITSVTYEWAKLDYLFASAGFAGCDSWTQLADQADYRYAGQPFCRKIPVPVCYPGGVSDHAPLIGQTRGTPSLSWALADGSGTTAADSSPSKINGTLQGGVRWSGDGGGAAIFDGTGAVVASRGAVDTARGFTVSAWARADAAAPTGVVVSQDSVQISGFFVYYQGGSWKFGMPRGDTAGWNVDIATAPARTGEWTHLTAVYDQVAKKIILYVNGVRAGEADHSAVWRATGAFVVGRNWTDGGVNAYWRGAVRGVTAYPYPLTPDEVRKLAGL